MNDHVHNHNQQRPEHQNNPTIQKASEAIAAELGHKQEHAGGTNHNPTPVQQAAAAVNTVEKSKEELAKEAEAAKVELHRTIKANFNNLVDVAEVKFHFRKVKDEATGEETKRPTITLPIASPSVEGIVNILEAGGKGLELLLEAVQSIVIDVAREYINENESCSADNFPFSMLGWEQIANMPKAERRGGGIAKETWEEFAKDYIAVMPAATGKAKEKIELASKVLLNKFAAVKTNKPVLKLLKEQLAIYLNATPNAEQFAECVDFLDKKAATLLAMDDAALLGNLI